MLSMEFAQGLDGKTRCDLGQLSTIHPEARLTGNRQLEHLGPSDPGCKHLSLLVGGDTRWQKGDLIQPTLLPAPLRQKEMPEMNRVKRTAKYSQAHADFRPPSAPEGPATSF